jgi:sodium-dependent dicarboxylate transporter 2/3/5
MSVCDHRCSLDAGRFSGLGFQCGSDDSDGCFCVDGVVAVKDLNKMGWDVLWLVAGGFALGLGLQKTGLAEHLLQAIPFASWPAFMVLIGGALIGLFMSTFMSNTAAASLLVPIVAALGVSMGSSLDSIGGVYSVIIGVVFGCSLAMSLPISTPPNALAYSTGFMKQRIWQKWALL